MPTTRTVVVRMTTPNRWRHALAAWRGQLTVNVGQDHTGDLLVYAAGEDPANFTALPSAWVVDEDGYWIAARNHLTLSDFKTAARPVFDESPWAGDHDKVIDRDGVQHAYAVRCRPDDKRPGVQDYVYERDDSGGTFEAVTIWGAGNLNDAGDPSAPEPVRS